MSVKSLGRLILDPTRIPREVLLRWPRASFETKLKWDAVERPGYAYGTYQAARQARALGLSGISVIEMGVAGSRGGLALRPQVRASPAAVPSQHLRVRFDMGSRLAEARGC